MRRDKGRATQCLAVLMSRYPVSLSLAVPSPRSPFAGFDMEEP